MHTNDLPQHAVELKEERGMIMSACNNPSCGFERECISIKD
jgi:hypothetical protein